MKLNNKAFTVVELIASFALTMVITVLLFEIVLQVKDIYQTQTIKSAIMEKTAIISKNMRRILPDDGSVIPSCSGSTCTIGSNTVSVSSTQVIIGKQKFNMPNTVSINSPSLTTTCEEGNCFLRFKMTLHSDNMEDDYVYNTIYYY